MTRRPRVCRRTVYYRGQQCAAREADDIAGRPGAMPRIGRPRTAHGIIDPLIDSIIDQDPRELGHRSAARTAGLLRQHLSHAQHLIVSSQRSVSYALVRLSLRWKRPRHQLPLRARYFLEMSRRGRLKKVGCACEPDNQPARAAQGQDRLP